VVLKKTILLKCTTLRGYDKVIPIEYRICIVEWRHCRYELSLQNSVVLHFKHHQEDWSDVKIDVIPYGRKRADDNHWLPLILNGKKFKGYFIFDDDVMLRKFVVVIDEFLIIVFIEIQFYSVFLV
jgi:hypothetical protein